MNNVVIKKVHDEFEECADVIRASFLTVALEFGITRENAPTNPAFAGADTLVKMKEKGIELYGAYDGSRCVGFVAVEKADEPVYYMERLAVLPDYRHRGIGRMLMEHVFETVGGLGGRKVSIGIINQNTLLKEWYAKAGFVETGIKTFKHLPFDVCFMEKNIG